jgi:hypothetical protein
MFNKVFFFCILYLMLKKVFKMFVVLIFLNSTSFYPRLISIPQINPVLLPCFFYKGGVLYTVFPIVNNIALILYLKN